MINCAHNNLDNKPIIDAMQTNYGLNRALAQQVFSVLNEDLSQINGLESILYNLLYEVTNNKKLAGQIIASICSSTFLTNFGDWTQGNSKLITNELGLPKLYFYTNNLQKTLYFESFDAAYANALITELLANTNFRPNDQESVREYYATNFATEYLLINTAVTQLQHGLLSEDFIKYFDFKQLSWYEMERALSYLMYGWLLRLNSMGITSPTFNIRMGFLQKTSQHTNSKNAVVLVGKLLSNNPLKFAEQHFTDLFPNVHSVVYEYTNNWETHQYPMSFLSRRNEPKVIRISPDVTLEKVEQDGSKALKRLLAITQLMYPNYYEALRKYPLKTKNFLTGIARILYTRGKWDIHDPLQIILFAKLYESLTSSPIIKSVGEEYQLEIAFTYASYNNPEAIVNEKYSKRLQAFLSGERTIEHLINSIVESDSKLKPIAEFILAHLPDVNLKIVEQPWKIFQNGKERLTDGIYDPETNTITLSKNVYNYPDSTILHEILHAITYKSIHNSASIYQQRALSIFQKALDLIFKKYKVSSFDELENKVNNPRLTYGFSNVDEFFSELWTNSQFIKELNSLGEKTKSGSILLRIKKFLLNIIGISEVSEIYEEANNLLTEILETGYQAAPLYYNEDELKDLDDIYKNLYTIEDTLNFVLAAPPVSDIILNKQLEEVTNTIVNMFKSGDFASKTVLILGKAGTGKTTIVSEIIKRIQPDSGNPPKTIVVAVSNAAKNNLYSKVLSLGKRALPDSASVASFLGLQRDLVNGQEIWKPGSASKRREALKKAGAYDIVFVDEASTLSQSLINEIKKFAPQALIVFIGDIRLLRPVDNKDSSISPIFLEEHDYVGELTERVRLGEGAAILDVADIFGDISQNPEGSTVSYSSLLSQTLVPRTNIQEANAIISQRLETYDDLIDIIYPLAKLAITLTDLNYVGIVPYNRSLVNTYNQKIRIKLLADLNIEASEDRESENYVGDTPYLKGEYAMCIEPYGTKIDNGTKFIFSSEPIKHSYHLTDLITIYYYELLVYDPLDPEKNQITIQYIPEKFQSLVNGQLKILGAQGERTHNFSKYWALKDKFAHIQPIWALNNHKALGQTYKIVYVPLDNHINHGDNTLRLLGENQALSELSSGLYTAITRSSNITILASKHFPLTETPDLVQLNESIETNKIKSPQEEIIETITLTPATSLQSSSSMQTKRNIPSGIMRKFYDFIVAVTGNDQLYDALITREGRAELKRLLKLYNLRLNELLKLGRTFLDVELKNGVYNYLEVVKSPEVLFYPINEARLKVLEQKYGKFPTIENLEVKGAEAVIPAYFAELFKLGNKSLAEINPKFFRTVNNFYKSPIEDVDLIVRTHTGITNVAIVDSLDNIAKYGKIINIHTDADGYRLDNLGNRMYFVPNGALICGDDNGNETIILINDQKVYGKTMSLIYSIPTIVSIQPILTNINNLKLGKQLLKLAIDESAFEINENQFNYLFYDKDITLLNLKLKLLEIYKDPRNEKTYSIKFSNTLWNSFRKALEISASRIPTLALASFMNMTVSAFNPNMVNDVFVSRWQLWLQGSDLDIDKSYMIGYSFSNSGLFIHWSRIADYSSKKRQEISDLLSIPNGLIIFSGDIKAPNNKIIIPNILQPDTLLISLVKQYISINEQIEQSKSDNKNQNLKENLKVVEFATLKDIVNYFNKVKTFNISEELLNNKYTRKLIRLINKHNTTKITEEIAKNIAVASIISVESDVANVLSAHSPIDAATKQLKNFLKDLETGTLGNEWDGFSIYKLQEDNQTGKKVVGVMANALKAFLSMTLYFNYYYLNHTIDPTSNSYFLNLFVIDGKTYNLQTVANEVLEQNLLHLLAIILKNSANLAEDAVKNKSDVSIILSAMVTLATDNAKELALAKLKASINLASMHTYLLTFGVPFEDVVKYTAKSELFSDLYDYCKQDGWEKSNGNINTNTWRYLYLRASLNTTDYTNQDVDLLKRLYNWALELRHFTSLLGINQGMKSQIVKAILFKVQFENLIANNYNTLVELINLNLTTHGNPPITAIVSVNDLITKTFIVDGLLRMHNLTPNAYLRSIIQNKAKNFISLYGNANLNETININKFFNDNQYRARIIDLYDFTKLTVNILDIIVGLPHFYSMLKGLNTTLLKTSQTAKGNFLFTSFIEKFNVVNAPAKAPKYLHDSYITDAQNFVDDYMISDFLITQNDILSFNYTLELTQNKGITVSVDFNTNEGLLKFSDFVHSMIVRLKHTDPNNEFLNSLILFERKNSQKVFQLNFNLDMLDRKNAGELELKYKQVIGGFNKIMDIPINTLFKNCSTQLSVGDVFFLYNLIYNFGKRGQRTLTAIFDNYYLTRNADSVFVKYLQTIGQFDSKNKSIEIESPNLMNYLYQRYQPKTVSSLLPILYNLNKIKTNIDKIKIRSSFIEAFKNGLINIEIDPNCK